MPSHPSTLCSCGRSKRSEATSVPRVLKDAELPKRILKNLLALFEQFGKLGGKHNDTPANRDHGND